MIIDTRTGKILVTEKQLIKDVKDYFGSMSDDELRARMKKEKRRIKKLKHRR